MAGKNRQSEIQGAFASLRMTKVFAGTVTLILLQFLDENGASRRDGFFRKRFGRMESEALFQSLIRYLSGLYPFDPRCAFLEELEQLSFGEVFDEAEVRGEEVVVDQRGERGPAHVVEDAVFE